MTGSNVGPACPGCGSPVDSPFCPRCGARTTVAGAPGAVPPAESLGVPAAAELPTAPIRPIAAAQQAPAPLVPPPGGMPPGGMPLGGMPLGGMPPGGMPLGGMPLGGPPGGMPLGGPPQAWSQVPDQSEAAPQTGLFPGWTGMYPAVATAGAGGVLAPRPERRRRAVYAVLAIAAATALVLLAAILIAPRWNSGPGVADKDGRPVPVTTALPTSTPSTSAPITGAPGSSASGGTGPSGTGPGGDARTVTGTATTGTATTGTATTGTATTGTATTGTATTGTATTGTATTGTARTGTARTGPRVAPASTHPATPTPAPPNQSTRATRPPQAPPTYPLVVPQRNIACSSGYIVQLASEFDAAAFTSRVSALRAAGQVPAAALAADAAQSCKIFTSQQNTLVLYAGPYPSRYAGCAARLAGPADAFIKGGNPGNAREYVSCLCPADPATLPRFTAVGQQGVWIGELQRVLGNRLSIGVGDLTGSWGVYTPGTRAAVEKFQLSVHLPTTGAVDARTWAALQAAEC